MPAGHVQRARIVQLAAEGVANTEISHRVGVARQTVLTWRDRYARYGLDGLGDRARPGRPQEVDVARVITATLRPPSTTS